MALTPQQFRSIIKTNTEKFLSEHGRIALLSALDTVALVKRRVINQRENDEGGIFGIYSKQYQKKRLENNLLGNQVNFSFTNKMWNSTTARIIENSGARVVVFISPDAANIEKLRYMTEKFGPILVLSEEEEQLHKEIYESKIKDI